MCTFEKRFCGRNIQSITKACHWINSKSREIKKNIHGAERSGMISK